MSHVRKEVLNIFKKLHRTNRLISAGNPEAISAGRNHINKAFRKNIGVRDEGVIKEMVNLARNMEEGLRASMEPRALFSVSKTNAGKLDTSGEITLTRHTYDLPEPELEPFPELSNVFPTPEDLMVAKKKNN